MKGRGARGRILAAAARLFYAHGVNRVGVDKIAADAEVTKTSLYRHFRSKDDLVVAFLKNMNDDWSGWLKGRVERASTEPRERLLAVFDALGEWFRSPAFRGCPFINTAAEFSDRSSPPARAATAFKREFRDYLMKLSKEARMRTPGLLADQLLLLADGAIVRAVMTPDARSDAIAKKAADALLRRSGDGARPGPTLRDRAR